MENLTASQWKLLIAQCFPVRNQGKQGSREEYRTLIRLYIRQLRRAVAR